MKLQRYNIARSTVSELQNANLIGPEEAAAAQAVKFGAITSGMASLSDMASGIAEIRGETELNNAVTDLDDAVRAIREDVDAMPVELDQATGNVKHDATDLVEMERNAREAVISAIRDNISSTSAKRAFDKHTTQLNMQLNQQSQVAQIERERVTLKANSELRTQKLLQEGRHNAALLQVQQDTIRGTLSTDEYNDARYEIKLDRDKDTFTRVLKNPNAQDSEIELMLDALQNGRFPDALGFDEPDLVMESEQILQWQGKLYQHANGVDKRASDARAEEQDQNTVVILRSVLAGEKSPQDIADLPLESVGLSGMKYLITQSRAMEEGLKSNQSAINEKYDFIMAMTVDGAINGEPEEIKQKIKNDDRIFGKDQLTLLTAVDTAVANVERQAPQRALLDTELVNLQGLTTLDTYAGASSDKRSERAAGEAMKLAFWNEARAMGAEFTTRYANEWINDNKVHFYKMALTDTLAERGIPMAGMPDTRVEAQEYIAGRLMIYLEDYFTVNEWAGMTKDEKSLALADEMLEVELLMRHVWGDK